MGSVTDAPVRSLRCASQQTQEYVASQPLSSAFDIVLTTSFDVETQQAVMEFSVWLAGKIAANDWTLGQAATYTGVNKSQLSLYLRRKAIPNLRTLKRLAKYFGASVDELDAMLPNQEDNVPIMVPEVSSVASAGPGGSTEPEQWPYLPPADEREHPFVVVPVRGDCLEPDIRQGERLLIDKWGVPRHNNYVVVRVDDEMLVKRVERRNGDLWLVANRHHEPIKLDASIVIEGVVRMIYRKPPV